MLSRKNKLWPANVFTGTGVYLLLALAGLSFCFFIGFPFENHNESFLWEITFKKVSLWDTLTRQVIGIETFRPLGMASAWIGYHLSGNIYLQQIINWLFATMSFALLFFTTRNRILFSVLSFIICTAFFSGYIYLFHLHGVFYGPFQLYVAFLTSIAYRQRYLSNRMMALLAVITLIAALYHTFALLVFSGFILGYMLQLGKQEQKKDYSILFILLVCTLVFAGIIMRGKEFKSIQTLSNGFLTSYYLVELNKSLSLVAALMAVIAASASVKTLPNKLFSGGVALGLSFICIWCHIPVLVLWIGICILNTIITKNWPLAALIASTAILPLGSGSGSPTYVVFAIMICTFITTSFGLRDIPNLVSGRIIAFAGVFFFLICLVALKNGSKVPLYSLALPILAEQEKTQQFKKILAWKTEQKLYASSRLMSYDAWNLPVNSSNSIARKNRPVTQQVNIDEYLDFLSKDSLGIKTNPPLYLTFGDRIIPGKQLIYTVTGKWNGNACVYK